jgi:signal transduction histidine kinase
VALTLTAVTAVVGAGSSIVDQPAMFVTFRTVFCVGLVVLALVVLARGHGSRMAGLLLALACCVALTGLAGADSRGWFATGRIAIPITIVLASYICLAYPSGWIEDRLASMALRTIAAVLLLLTAANVLVSNVPPVAGPFVRCSGVQCPSNPLNLIDIGSGPSIGLSSALAIATGLSLAIVATLVARRWATTMRLQRRGLAPLLTWAAASALGYGLYITVREVDSHSPLLTPAAVVVVAIIATMPFAILLGLARAHVFAISALERMIVELGEQSSLLGLQQTVSRAFSDPTLKLLMWRPNAHRYVDIDGNVVNVSAPELRGKVTDFSRDRDTVAAVIHDPFLSNDVLEAAGSAVHLALDNTRLQNDLSASIRALEASRKRVASAADEERRRIEQDLHDGAQQGLIALRIKLQLLQEVATEDPEAIVPALADAGARVDATLDHIRNLAKGIYPSVLRDLGLSYALATVIRELPVRVVLQTELERRFEPEVETAIYFCCVEALQNIAKHCGAHSRAGLLLSERRHGLRFLLTDDGPGFDPARTSNTSGITGMRDRLEAIGGQLTISSVPGHGTTITGHVPSHAL